MRRYAAYGLRIDSELDIPWFLEDLGSDEACVLVRHLPSLPAGTLATSIGSHDTARSELRYERTCYLEVSGGTEIGIAGEVGVGDEELAAYVAGVGMGVLQHQLGRLVLHASAVRSPAGAVAFLGESKWGKSTTAAALHFHGWPLVTDDVAAFVRDPRGHLALIPSFPFMRLWPDSLQAVGRDPDEYPPIFPGADKRRVAASAGFESRTEKLAALYILGEGPRVEMVEIGRHEAFAELVRHSFAVRALEDSGPQAWHAELAAGLVRETRIRRLLGSRSGATSMEAIVEAVLRDVEQDT